MFINNDISNTLIGVFASCPVPGRLERFNPPAASEFIPRPINGAVIGLAKGLLLLSRFIIDGADGLGNRFGRDPFGCIDPGTSGLLRG